MTTSPDLLWHVADRTIPAALSLLPGRMDSPAARAMLLSIGLQESGFAHRRQVGGPAHGFWQFEKHGGIKGVLEHPLTHPIITPVCDLLLYPATTIACYDAVVDNAELACCFARCLLWTDPRALPASGERAKGWAIYLSQWRPGKPHPDTWAAHFAHAWRLVNGD